MADKFTFSSAGEAQEVEFSLARNDWTHVLLKQATQGNFLGLVREVLEGRAEICRIERLMSEADLVATPTWHEQNDVIFFSVISDGTTGSQWINRLEQKGFHVSDYAKSLLRSKDFKPTSGITTKIAILKGTLFSDDDRITKKIRSEADKRKFTKPNAEVACLIRGKFTDQEIEAMGLYWIIAMHEPIKDSGGGPLLLFVDRVGGGRWLFAYYGYPDDRWYRGGGFAFVVSQVSA